MPQQLADDIPVTGNHDDPDYDAFRARVQVRFVANVGGGPVFETDAADLFAAYLDALPSDQRRYHNCSACRRFFEQFGGLATIDETGQVASATWNPDDAPDLYRASIAAVAKLVRRAKVTGPFLSSLPVWGQPETGIWRHLAIASPWIFSRVTETAGQAMAAKRQDFLTVQAALSEFPLAAIHNAVAILRGDALYRSEKVLGQAEWLQTLHVARDAAKGARRANVVWRAIATAPAGFCHPRSSMIGTLLEDIVAGLTFGEAQRRFAAKMHPLQYQRPQAAPTAGAIAQAEKVIEQLAAAGSLARRFARLDEVQALWRPPTILPAAPRGGVFGHLKPKSAPVIPSMQAPPQTMTWEKFQREALPTAERIELRTPHTGPYTAFVTAVNPEAPPILQWDREDARNPVSWYFWHGGSSAGSFGLRGSEWTPVTAITLKPSMWNGGQEHQGKGLTFLLQGAADTKMAGAAIFPETLKAEFHGIRSIIEAYSRAATIENLHPPMTELAAGLGVTAGRETWDVELRVFTNGHTLNYKLDRWD